MTPSAAGPTGPSEPSEPSEPDATQRPTGAGSPDHSPGDELVEWVDDDDRVVEVVTRARMRRENLRHRSTAVVILSTDGRRLLAHRRSADKDLRPGWWDVCAGGVLGVGESDVDGARRELAEEIGITATTLTPLGRGRFDDVDSREVASIFLTHHDGPFEFADGEVAEARFVTRDELRTLMATEPFLPSCDAMILPLVPGFAPDRATDPPTTPPDAIG